jgi:hypothetical protein
VTGYWEQMRMPHDVGLLHFNNGGHDTMRPRDMANKVIHSRSISWMFDPEPRAICAASPNEKWRQAEINVRALITLGGLFRSPS